MPVKKSELSSTPKTKRIVKKSKPVDSNGDNQTILNVSRSDIKKSIKWGKIAKWATWGYLIWVVAVVVIGFGLILSLIAEGGEYEGSNLESAINVLDYIAVLIGLILVVIWLCKSYNILLKSGREGLYFKSTSAIGWGAFLPIVHLWYPYKAVKDLYKHFNAIVGKSFNKGLLGRWWFFWITRLISTRLVTSDSGDELLGDGAAYRIAWFIMVITFVTSSILFVKIVNKIMRAQKVYLKRTRQTLQE